MMSGRDFPSRAHHIGESSAGINRHNGSDPGEMFCWAWVAWEGAVTGGAFISFDAAIATTLLELVPKLKHRLADPPEDSIECQSLGHCRALL